MGCGGSVASYSRGVLYLFALIGVAAVGGTLWAAMRPRPNVTKRPTMLPPDDNPEFLRRLNKRPPDDDRAT